MSFYTHILYSSKLQRFYKGSCADVQVRLARHNSGGENATAAGRPWKLIWFTTKESRSEAVKLELKLKNLSAIRLLQFIAKYQENINPTEHEFWTKFTSEQESSLSRRDDKCRGPDSLRLVWFRTAKALEKSEAFSFF